MLFVVILCASLTGCTSGRSKTLPPAARKDHVLAQGQVMPAGGVVRLSGAPGDIVAAVEVKVGQDVEADQELVQMRSSSLRSKQLLALHAQKKAAQQQAQQKTAQASQQVRIATAKLENVRAIEDSLPRKEKLITIAKAQLTDAKEVLAKLKGISKNKLTKEFVGDLEVDKQAMVVRDAELKLGQQQETYDQAVQDVELAKKAALIELEVAEELLMAAKEFSPVEVIDAQIATLQEEMAAAKILAPVGGRVLAVNARRGEASVPQVPLVEMADLSEIVVEAEINERDAAQVKVGQSATISSRAFKPISGKVLRVDALVGKPQLKPLDPLARKDYRSKVVTIELDDTNAAKEWLQLQVEVKIETPIDSSKASE